MPEVFEGANTIKEAHGTADFNAVLEKVFPEFPSISIDYGVMEKAESIYVIPGNFGWDDVGSWLAVERIKNPNEAGNIVNGNVVTVNTKNCIIQCDKKLIATVGLEDIVIVDTDDATLICDKASTADIKKILENLRADNKNQYL